HAVHTASESVVADIGGVASRCSVTRARTASANRDSHGCSGIAVERAGVEITGDRVVTVHTLELVEGTVVTDVVCRSVEEARRTEISRVIAIVKIATLHPFDRAQRIVANDVAHIVRHRTGSHVDDNTTGGERHAVVTGDIEAAAAVDEVITAQAG